MQENSVKRPRLKQIDLEIINDALDDYIKFLKKQEAEAKPEKPDGWIRARERLHWKVLNAKNTKTKIAMNLKNSQCGRTPKTVKRLFNVTRKDGLGEYIFIGEALGLMPEDLDLETEFMALSNATHSGVVDSYIHQEEERRVFRKLDVMRLAAYLEVHG